MSYPARAEGLVNRTTRIVWVSGKLYKPGKNFDPEEWSKKAERFHRKSAPLPCVCVHACISAISDSLFSYIHFRWYRKTRKEADYIFIHQHCFSSLYKTVTPSLPLLSGALWPRVVLPVRVPTMAQIEWFNYLLYWKPLN